MASLGLGRIRGSSRFLLYKATILITERPLWTRLGGKRSQHERTEKSNKANHTVKLWKFLFNYNFSYPVFLRHVLTMQTHSENNWLLEKHYHVNSVLLFQNSFKSTKRTANNRQREATKGILHVSCMCGRPIIHNNLNRVNLYLPKHFIQISVPISTHYYIAHRN